MQKKNDFRISDFQLAPVVQQLRGEERSEFIIHMVIKHYNTNINQLLAVVLLYAVCLCQIQFPRHLNLTSNT